MDTRVSAGLFELTLPGVWTKTAPSPGLVVFRSGAGSEQLSISSLKTREPLSDDDQHHKLRDVVRVRRETEARQVVDAGEQVTLSDVTYRQAPNRAEFTSETGAGRHAATLVVARVEGFVVLYLESFDPDPAKFDDLAARVFNATSRRPSPG
jgi:hypothetical protein